MARISARETILAQHDAVKAEIVSRSVRCCLQNATALFLSRVVPKRFATVGRTLPLLSWQLHSALGPFKEKSIEASIRKL
jgi:hypothetical protein